jgi:phosphoenolpyruvate synthase/pyruvate phosphate dikinase
MSKQWFQSLSEGLLSGEVGGKARGLAALLAAGWKIPESRVVGVEDLAALAGSDFEDPSFLDQAGSLFRGGGPVIVRSSAVDEDGRGRSWAGVFESVIAKSPEELPGAFRRVHASFKGERAAAYRSAHGLPAPERPGMAAVVQPFLLGDSAGVATLFHRARLVVEAARGHNVAITSGKGAPVRREFALGAGRTEPAATGEMPRADLNAVVDAVFGVQESLFRNQNIAVEFSVKDGDVTLLQVRPNPSGVEAEDPVDLPGIYARFCALLDGMGFRREEWSLLETFDLMAFHRLGRRRPRGEPLEHFRVRLHGDAALRAKDGGWLKSRHGGEDGLYSPPPEDRASRGAIQALADDGILVVFNFDERNEFSRREEAFACRGETVSLGFSDALAETDIEEWAFEKRRLDRAEAARTRSHLDRMLRDLDLMEEQARASADARAAQSLEQIRMMREQALRHREITEEVLREGVADEEIAGIPFEPRDAVVEGVAVTERSISDAPERFVYFADDLEPSFLDKLGSMKAVVVSRGAFCSHAAALCSEFSIPLIVETRNLPRVKDGARVSVDLSSGKVRLI